MTSSTAITTLIISIISFNSILFCQEQKECIDHGEPITIKPLYIADTPQATRDAKNTELLEQDSKSIKKPNNPVMRKPAQWILESSIKNAPALLKGIVSYLQIRTRNYEKSYSVTIPSFHRFILVGPPGSGKTTMAHAIADKLGLPAIYIGASSFLGRFRNETARNIQMFLKEHAADGLAKIIIIDELHKLFELHNNDQADDYQNAAAFWLAIDAIEKCNPNIIIIATANNVDKLPPEIKSRFSGKIITMPLPSKWQKIKAFEESIIHDNSIMLDESIDDVFIEKMIQQIQDCSLRDVQLIIDTAKIFYYAEESTFCTMLPILLTKAHFQQALDQLDTESQVLQEKLLDRLCKKLEPWGTILSAAANIGVLMTTFVNVQAHLTV